ncbi:MAG TPA: MBL fold metallo-hydrolase [Ktedonobacterales bacterium]|jgi:ribonuclease BN (tRNA processing enzyme)
MSETDPEEQQSSGMFAGEHPSEEASAMAGEFVLRFWGVRGSYPVSGGAAQRVGGSTSCVEARVGGHEIILDAGTGLIPFGQLFRERMKASPPTITILFSHLHYDHILGLPFFDPLYQPGATLHLAGPRLAGKSFSDTLCGAITSPYFPVDLCDVPSTCQFYTLEPGDYFQWRPDDSQPQLRGGQLNGAGKPLAGDEVRVTFLHTPAHPRNGCLISRIEYKGRSVVYATDVEWGQAGNQSLIHFAEGADLLIHDAQYSEEDYLASKRGFGHSTPRMATEVARAAGVKRLLLFHHDPEHDDALLEQLQRDAQRDFPATSLAFEGLEAPIIQAP